jgi:flavorubredoxin
LKSFPGTSRLVKLCVKDRAAVRESLEEILSWDFERVVVSHGEIITENAKETLRQVLAWGLAPAS